MAIYEVKEMGLYARFHSKQFKDPITDAYIRINSFGYDAQSRELLLTIEIFHEKGVDEPLAIVDHEMSGAFVNAALDPASLARPGNHPLKSIYDVLRIRLSEDERFTDIRHDEDAGAFSGALDPLTRAAAGLLSMRPGAEEPKDAWIARMKTAVDAFDYDALYAHYQRR